LQGATSHTHTNYDMKNQGYNYEHIITLS